MSLKKQETIRRYVFLFVGLFVNALGVSLITKANLGTSPITSIPYNLNMEIQPKVPMFSLGAATFVFNILLILVQLALLRKNFKLSSLLQLPVVLIFSVFIDMTMAMLSFVQPTTYPAEFISLIIGCIILGFGVFMEMVANVVMLPGEATARAISWVTGSDFGKTKVLVDTTMTVTAIILSFIFFGKLCGVREGTIISALAVGFIARNFKKIFYVLETILVPTKMGKGRIIVNGKEHK